MIINRWIILSDQVFAFHDSYRQVLPLSGEISARAMNESQLPFKGIGSCIQFIH